jgi:branched-chain amino acid transport system ATP-binding protein
MGRTIPASEATNLESLEVHGATVDFQGLRAIEDVSLKVSSGEILGLIGPNGAGKTTLVNVLTGFQPLRTGRVSVGGACVTGWPAWRRARAGLARTFQNVLLFPKLSTLQNIEAGALAVGQSASVARGRALEVLDWLGLRPLAAQLAGTLPFGAERKIGIGRAIAARPKFLLMDEPAAGLNDSECSELAELIRRIRGEMGCGILLIEHRMSLVFSLCDRVQVLEQGRTIASGAPEVIRRDARVRAAYLGEVA